MENMREKVSTLYAGNPSWQNYMSTYLLTSPDILIGLGIVKESGKGEFAFQLRSGRRIKVALQPMSLETSDKPIEAGWDLSPFHPGRFGPWLSLL